MNSRQGIRPKPEEEELNLKRRELSEHERELVERELQLIGMKGELAAFEQVYVQKVGAKYVELDEINAQIAELRAGRDPNNSGAKSAANAARTRADESYASAAGQANKQISRVLPNSSLKSLYREVARRIHPDLAVDETDRTKRQMLMAEANRAYQNGDEDRLRAILDEYNNSPESVLGDDSVADLIRVIRKIAQVKRRLIEIDLETNNLKSSDLYVLKKRIDEGTRQGRDLLKEMATALNLQIEERRTLLRQISRDEGK